MSLGMAAYIKTPTELAATTAAWNWAKLIPFASAALDVAATAHDVRQTINDYNECIAGS